MTPPGACVKTSTSFFVLRQLSKTPTELLQNSAICIDPVFTNLRHLVIDSRFHSSLCSTYHHEIAFARLNLKAEYPLSYEHISWDYFRAGKSSINRAINAIDW